MQDKQWIKHYRKEYDSAFIKKKTKYLYNADCPVCNGHAEFTIKYKINSKTHSVNTFNLYALHRKKENGKRFNIRRCDLTNVCPQIINDFKANILKENTFK